MTLRRTWSLGLLCSILLGLVGLAFPAVAHDLWIEPSNFTPDIGAAVAFHLRVGQQWAGDPLPRSSKRILRFIVAGPDGTTDIAGAEAVDPAGLARFAKPGLYLAGYASHNAPLEQEAPKFEEYLRLEGLDWVVAERARRHESALASREVYARCAKSLLRAGDAAGKAADSGFDRILGFTLELVPERNPYALRAGDKLSVRLLFHGKPIANVWVAALPKAHPGALVSARSDARGRVRLPLGEAGAWLIKAVHMVRLEGAAAAAEQADWQSYWASLSFVVP